MMRFAAEESAAISQTPSVITVIKPWSFQSNRARMNGCWCRHLGQ
jgi:hypothetical protein